MEEKCTIITMMYKEVKRTFGNERMLCDCAPMAMDALSNKHIILRKLEGFIDFQ